ncbi:Hypp2735 [Branchiostoma lanceolatum]|uniref:Hypp2735 protein n=1 Tax=Branchiostoma lanceolatum TaxID=7740 RepID=A0A8K0ERQ4_BRALA|nr:Hypp2735 [Branchiostoma lanceolatum]
MSSKWAPWIKATTSKQSPGTVKTYSRKIPVTRIEDDESAVFPLPCRSNPFSDEEDQLKQPDKKERLVAELQSHNCHSKCSVETLQTPSKNRLCGEEEGPTQNERFTSEESDTKSICGPLPLIKGKKITHASWKLAGVLGKKKWPSFFRKTRTGTPVAAGKHQQWIKKPRRKERNQEDPEDMSLGDDSVFEKDEEHSIDTDSSEDSETSAEESDYSESESDSDSQSDTEVLRDTDAITDELRQFKIRSQLSPDWSGQQKLADVPESAPTAVQGQKLTLYHRSLPKEVYVSKKFHLVEAQRSDSGRSLHQLFNQKRKIRQDSAAETSRPFTSYEDDSLEEQETSSQSSFDSDSSSLRSILKTGSKTSKKADRSVKDQRDDGERKQVSFSPEVRVSQIDKNTTQSRQRSPLVIKSCTAPANVTPSLICQKMMLQKAKRKAGVGKTTETSSKQPDSGKEAGEEGRRSRTEGRATQSFNSSLLADSQPVATGVPVIKRHADYLQLNSTLVDNALACSILKLDPPGVSPIADAARTTKALLDEVTPLSIHTQPRTQTEGISQKHSVEKRFLKPTKTGEKETTQEQIGNTDGAQDVRKRKSETNQMSQTGLRSPLNGSSQGSGSKRVRFSADLSASTNNARNTNASLVVKSIRSSSEKQQSMSNSRKKAPATPHHSTGRVRQRVSTAKSSRHGRNVTLQASKDLSSIHLPTYDESDLLINNSLPGVTVNSQEIAPDSLSFEQQNRTSRSVKAGTKPGSLLPKLAVQGQPPPIKHKLLPSVSGVGLCQKPSLSALLSNRRFTVTRRPRCLWQ